MPKKQRQIKALNRLRSQLQAEKESRLHLQTQSYYLIVPSDNELRLADEIRNIEASLGMCPKLENPF